MMFHQCLIANRQTVIRYCRSFDRFTHNSNKFLRKQQCSAQQSNRFYHSVGDAVASRSKSFGSFSIKCEPFVNAVRIRHTLKTNRCLLTRRNYCTKESPLEPKKIKRNLLSIRKQHQESKKEIRRLFSLAKNEKWYLLGAIGCLCISSAVTLGVPHAIGKIMDMIVMDDFPREKLHQFCFILFGVFIAGSLANFGRIYLMNSATLRIVKDLRSRLYRTMLNQEAAWYDTKGTGELVNRLSNDTTLVGNSLSQNLSDGLRSIITIAAGTSMMVYTSPQLSLVAVCVVPFIGGLAILFGTYVKNITKMLLDKLAEVMRIGEERLNNVKTVKMFCKEEHENRLFTTELENALHLGYKDIYARASFYGIAGFSGNAIIISVLYYGGSLVSSNALTIGALTSFVFYAGYTGMAMTGLTRFYTELNKGVGAAARIWEIFDRPLAIPVNEGIIPTHTMRGAIELANVSFNFPSRPNVNILRNVNLKIEPNTVTAIVGRSGSGKSTIASLLLRLYEPQEGKIFLDGLDITQLDSDWLRNNIACVAQEPALFSGTIRENILYGLKSTDDERNVEESFHRVAQQSYVDDFVKALPDGYNTMVGQRGMTLSGGQKQRVAIARALIRNPKILILDEATSALDSVSEAAIQKSLENVAEGRTVLTIAHRLSTIRNAQKIIVVGNQSILEQGSYDELISNRKGIFRDLVKQQTFESTPTSHVHVSE